MCCTRAANFLICNKEGLVIHKSDVQGPWVGSAPPQTEGACHENLKAQGWPNIGVMVEHHIEYYSTEVNYWQ